MHPAYIQHALLLAINKKPNSHEVGSILAEPVCLCVLSQVAVSVGPQEWWQHAVHAVLKERSQLQGTDISQLSCVARRHLRLEYSKVYSQHRWSRTWLACHSLSLSPLYRFVWPN